MGNKPSNSTTATIVGEAHKQIAAGIATPVTKEVKNAAPNLATNPASHRAVAGPGGREPPIPQLNCFMEW